MNTQSHRTESYRIVGTEGAWRVAQDDRTGMSYATKEAAFEAAVGAAANAIKAGREVHIQVPGADRGDSLLGGRDWQELS